MPKLLPENEEIFKVYLQARNQVITAGMDGQAIDISIPAIDIVIRYSEIENKKECFERVLELCRHEIELRNKKNKKSED